MKALQRQEAAMQAAAAAAAAAASSAGQKLQRSVTTHPIGSVQELTSQQALQRPASAQGIVGNL